MHVLNSNTAAGIIESFRRKLGRAWIWEQPACVGRYNCCVPRPRRRGDRRHAPPRSSQRVVYEPTDPKTLEADYRVLEDGRIERSKQPSRWRKLVAPILPILLFVATKL